MDETTYTEEERRALASGFTNADESCFALTGLDETVKGALFARYSRSPKGIRRIWLDEFREAAERTGGAGNDRAQALYDKVLGEYGDDSVAQLGSAHVACENVSNVLTKVLERGRLMSYLEQSTRYIPYDTRVNGRWRYLTPPEVKASGAGQRYERAMGLLFATYAEWLPKAVAHFEAAHPRRDDEPAAAYKRAVRARALDALRGLLPAATQSNVGIHGSGQAFEALVLRLTSHPLTEARGTGRAMLEQLKAVIPAFVQRIERSDRGELWRNYLENRHQVAARTHERLMKVAEARQTLGAAAGRSGPTPEVDLLEWDADGEAKVIAALGRSGGAAPMRRLMDAAMSLTPEERRKTLKDCAGLRLNRRHRPGRALEATSYTFEVTGDYGIFRDLQRHRMLSIDWEPLSTLHGMATPDTIIEMNATADWNRAMETAAAAAHALESQGALVAQYAVPMAFRIRFCMRLNAREAMHMLELRTQPAGHPSYRRVCQQMHRLIAERAGHRGIAAIMSFVNHDDSGLGRRDAEARSAAVERTARGVAAADLPDQAQ